MQDILDLEAFPIDQPESAKYGALVARCKADLACDGMFNLTGLVKPAAAVVAAAEIAPVMHSASFTHKRLHNIYFLKSIDGLDPDHPALQLCETVNHTVCADQIPDSLTVRIYEYPPLLRFLEAVMDKDRLYLMDDPLARANVMTYRHGEALNWHFDRSEFTTTLLLQAPDEGGEFQYRSDLRTNNDPNYDGVAKLLTGEDREVRTLALSAGTLNVFRGKNTAHRVTPVAGGRDRMIAVFSYYERPGVTFSDEERIGFYGRAG
ncbi:MAG: HalD/BesD family halogenase [Aestuariivirgaceae bacterium]